MKRPREVLTLSPRRIAGLYFVSGVLWIILSDRIVERFVDLPITSGQIQTIKGSLFVIGSALLIFGLARTRENQTKAVKRELERQVDLFDKAQDIAQIGAWEYDIQADEGWWTDELAHIHGLSPDATPSPERSLEFYHPEDRPIIQEAFERAVTEGEPYDLELRFIDADGEFRWIRTRGEPQFEDGDLVRVRGTLQDITDRKEREEELRELTERLDLAVEGANLGVWDWDMESDAVTFNEQWAEMLGLSLDEIEPTLDTWEQRVHPEDIDEVKSALDAHIKGETDYYDTEHRMQTAAGEWKWIRDIGRIVERDEDGEPSRAVGIHLDITDRKQREAQLRRRKRAIDEAPVGITITDPEKEDNPLIYANDSFEDITGYSREEVLGKNCRFLQGEKTDPGHVARIRKAIDAHEPVSIELRNYRDDGTEFWNHLEIAPVKNDADEVVNYIGFQQDVTGRKQRQQQLEILDRVLRHNLRNDLNVIQGHAELIQSTASGESAMSAEKIINKTAELLGMAEKEQAITQLLREKPRQTEITVEPLLQRIASTLRSDYPEARITVDCPENVTIQATPEFEQAIRELVTNAIIHNDSSTPTIAMTVARLEEATRIEIVDNGPYIPEMEQQILLGEEPQTPLYHGSGLGLWLVTLIVSRSGGTTTFEKNSTDGNTVGIELPR